MLETLPPTGCGTLASGGPFWVAPAMTREKLAVARIPVNGVNAD